MKYKILQSDNIHRLENAVKDAIEEGWRPLGGVAAASKAHGQTEYNQAMILEVLNIVHDVVKGS